MQVSILALLPKKGDLHDLRNWCPVSLLSTDYKVIAKAILLQLGSVLADVVHPDQTYTIPAVSSLITCIWSRISWSVGVGMVCHSPSCLWIRRRHLTGWTMGISWALCEH
ncbi:unnamed protein product [Lepidochelys olivacea]